MVFGIFTLTFFPISTWIASKSILISIFLALEKIKWSGKEIILDWNQLLAQKHRSELKKCEAQLTRTMLQAAPNQKDNLPI